MRFGNGSIRRRAKIERQDKRGSIDLGFKTSLNLYESCVSTQYRDGVEAFAYREETYENYEQALEQGYTRDSNGLYRSLAEHEALHTVVSRYIYDEKDSAIVLQSTGLHIHIPYWRRLHEESVVLATQLYLNTKQITQPIYLWIEALMVPALEIREKLDQCLNSSLKVIS